MVRKIGNDWSQRKLYFQLKQKLEMEKLFRDAWLRWTVKAIERCEEPLSHHMTKAENLAFQRKTTCYYYNQYGLNHNSVIKLPWNDYALGWSGHPGTGNWVNIANMSNLMWYSMIRRGSVMVHKCHVRGFGTDPHLQKGYEYRWKKCMDRDYGHYSRP